MHFKFPSLHDSWSIVVEDTMVTRSQPLAGPLLHSWFGGGFSTIFIPLLVFLISRWAHTSDDNDNADNNNDAASSPWWFFGTTVHDNNPNDGAPPVLIATYLWSLLVFFGILFYGFYVMRTGSDLAALVVALVLLANYSLLSLFLLGGVEGAIETDGPAIDEHGFAGQFGVMMYLTALLWVLFAVIFAVLFYRKAKNQFVIKVEVDRSDYESDDGGGAYQRHDEKPNTATV